jgi:adenylyltransferase/sulfurtransferase
VLGGLDNREARVHVNQACWKAGIPWIDGAIEGLLGVARVFIPPHSACYECTMNKQDHKLLAARRACSLLTRDQMLEGKVPTTVTSASVIAAIQVQEAVKLLHRDQVDYDLGGRGFVFNGMTHDSYVVTYPRREDCLSHDSYGGAWQHLPGSSTLSELLARAGELLGPEAIIEFEHELALSSKCPGCGHVAQIRRPLSDVHVQEAICPACGAESTLTLVHGVSRADDELLALSAREVGIPAFDVVTARAGEQRRFFVLGEGAALEAITNDG